MLNYRFKGFKFRHPFFSCSSVCFRLVHSYSQADLCVSHDLEIKKKSSVTDNMSSFTSPHLNPFSNLSDYILFNHLPAFCIKVFTVKSPRKGNFDSAFILTEWSLEGRRGKEASLISTVSLPTALQSVFEELTPLSDAGNIFGHVFSNPINCSMVKLPVGGIDFSLCV